MATRSPDFYCDFYCAVVQSRFMVDTVAPVAG